MNARPNRTRPIPARPNIARFGLCLACACTLALAAGGCKGRNASQRDGAIRGGFLVAACDADMSDESLATRELGTLDPRIRDTLTIVTLPIQEPTTPFAQINVSNSALGPSTSMALSPDQRTLFVVESRGPAPEGARTLDDLPPGENLTVVDVRDPLSPQVRQTVYVGTEPASVSVNTAGTLLAIATRTPNSQLVICRLSEGGGALDGDPLSWPLMSIGDEEARPASIAWRPRSAGSTGGAETLAVTLPERGEVMFYRVSTDSAGDLTLAPWGEPVSAGKYPYSGAFSPDGRFFIVNSLGWGADVAGFSVGAGPGAVHAIRLGTIEREEEGNVEFGEPHAVVSSANVGVSPESLAISRDGRLIVTANQQHTPSAADAAEGVRGGSLSLLRLNPDSGELSVLGEYAINAVPSAVTFDAGDEHVVVAQFRSFDPSATDGEAGFWAVRGRGPNTRLEPMDLYVGLGKGPHGILIAE